MVCQHMEAMKFISGLLSQNFSGTIMHSWLHHVYTQRNYQTNQFESNLSNLANTLFCVSRTFADHIFQHFIAKFHQCFQGKDWFYILNLNILDDLKIVDYRKFSLLQLANSFFSVSFNEDHVSMSLYCYPGLTVINLCLRI